MLQNSTAVLEPYEKYCESYGFYYFVCRVWEYGHTVDAPQIDEFDQLLC